MRKAIIAIVCVAAVASLVLLSHHKTEAADHRQSIGVAGMAADIQDLTPGTRAKTKSTWP